MCIERIINLNQVVFTMTTWLPTLAPGQARHFAIAGALDEHPGDDLTSVA